MVKRQLEIEMSLLDALTPVDDSVEPIIESNMKYRVELMLGLDVRNIQCSVQGDRVVCNGVVELSDEQLEQMKCSNIDDEEYREIIEDIDETWTIDGEEIR